MVTFPIPTTYVNNISTAIVPRDIWKANFGRQNRRGKGLAIASAPPPPLKAAFPYDKVFKASSFQEQGRAPWAVAAGSRRPSTSPPLCCILSVMRLTRVPRRLANPIKVGRFESKSNQQCYSAHWYSDILTYFFYTALLTLDLLCCIDQFWSYDYQILLTT